MNEQMELESNHIIDDLPEYHQPLLDTLLNHKIEVDTDQNAITQTNRYPYSLTGYIASFNQQGFAIVNFELNNKYYNLKAESTVELNTNSVGKKCVIIFNRGDITNPIITGLLKAPLSIDTDFDDGEPLVIQSENKIVLKCGSSFIELNNDGFINIQGLHINNQAYGPNRIKGGSVKIN